MQGAAIGIEMHAQRRQRETLPGQLQRAFEVGGGARAMPLEIGRERGRGAGAEPGPRIEARRLECGGPGLRGVLGKLQLEGERGRLAQGEREPGTGRIRVHLQGAGVVAARRAPGEIERAVAAEPFAQGEPAVEVRVAVRCAQPQAVEGHAACGPGAGELQPVGDEQRRRTAQDAQPRQPRRVQAHGHGRLQREAARGGAVGRRRRQGHHEAGGVELAQMDLPAQERPEIGPDRGPGDTHVEPAAVRVACVREHERAEQAALGVRHGEGAAGETLHPRHHEAQPARGAEQPAAGERKRECEDGQRDGQALGPGLHRQASGRVFPGRPGRAGRAGRGRR